MTNAQKITKQERPPVIVIMGHIDHGKSTLLDYIRSTNIVDKEAGGITQHISAYEVVHETGTGDKKRITFLDTPGHEAFQSMRSRGAVVADIAVLIVSAEDGVKPQTLEALKCILAENMPYIVAINKIDKPGADINRTIATLIENEIYLEGYGGTIPYVPISAKTGKGIPELLDMMLLVAEVEELTMDPSAPAVGAIIESSVDARKGMAATVVIKDGSIHSGMFAVAGESVTPVRMMEDFRGKSIKEATASSPIRLIGWNSLPKIGSIVHTFATRKEAEAAITEFKTAHLTPAKQRSTETEQENKIVIPIIIKADVSGTVEAVEHEFKKLITEKVTPHIILSGTGEITENDVKTAVGLTGAVIMGFNVKIDAGAHALADRLGVTIQTFDIIYKMSEWLQGIITDRTPKVETEEIRGVAKVLKVFSKTKDKHVLGGKAESGEIHSGDNVKIMRRESEIAIGKVRELQHNKIRVDEVKEGYEFGAMIESRVEIMPGDRIQAFTIVTK